MGRLVSSDDSFAVTAPGPGLTLPLLRSGLRIGRDRQGRDLLMHLFGEEPVSACTVVAPGLLAVLLARVLGQRAELFVHTAHPRRWELIRERLGATQEDLSIGSDPQSLLEPPGFARPTLVVRELLAGPDGAGSRVSPTDRVPWRSSLTVLDGFTPAAAAAARACSPVLCGPLPAAEASLLARVLDCPPTVADELRGLGVDGLAVLHAGEVRFARADLDEAELRLWQAVTAVTAVPAP